MHSAGRTRSVSNSQIQVEAPHYDSVWGTFSPSVWTASHRGMILSRYYMPVEDNTLVSGNSLSFFLQNHPSWVLYGCDNNNNPTTDYAWSGTGFQDDTPLDIHNPQVVAYQMQTLLNFLTSHGYNAIAIDNVVFVNFLLSPNTELEPGKRSNSGWYGCGIYTNGPSDPGSFVRRYSGGFDAPDPTFIADMQNWVAQAKATLGAHGIKVIVNHPPFSSSPNANEQQMLGNIDGMLDENGYTHFGTLLTGSAFGNTLSWVAAAASPSYRRADYELFLHGHTNCSNDPATLSQQQVDWALASYAIGNNGGENVFISPHGGAIFSFRNEYTARYGTACGPMTQNGNLYMRRFSGGFAVVNANAARLGDGAIAFEPHILRHGRQSDLQSTYGCSY